MHELADIFPADWDTKTIGDIASHVGSGATPTGGSAVYSTTGITFIRSQNVTFKGLLLDDVAFIEPRIHQQMTRSEIFPHDVLLNITGASIGRCCFVPYDFGIANVNQHVCAIRFPKPSHEDAVFLSGVLASHIGQSQIDRLNAGGNREGLNYQQVRSFVVPWPRPEERKRIAAILEAADKAIAKTEAVIAKLKQVREGLFHDLLIRGLDKHGQLRDPIAYPEQFQDSTLGCIPCEWRVLALSNVAEKIQDGTHFSPKTKLGPRRYLTSKNVRFGFLDLSDCGWISEAEHQEIFRRCDVRENDILLTKDGANTGNASLNTLDEEFSLLSSVALIRCRAGLSHHKFVLNYLLSPTGQKRLKDLMSGNAITRLTLQKIKNFAVPLPPFDEQMRIAKQLEGCRISIESTECEMAKLHQLRGGLMSDLLTGRVRVPEEVAVAP